jgi:hypothetical protein
MESSLDFTVRSKKGIQMRYSIPLLFSVVAGVSLIACGDAVHSAVASETNNVQALDSGSGGQAANPNGGTCQDLAARADNVVQSLSDAYSRLQAGEDISADLSNILTDATDIASDVTTCIGQSTGSTTGSTTGSIPAGEQQQEHQEQQEQQEQQAQEQQAQEQQAQEQQGQVAQEQQAAGQQQAGKPHQHHHHRHH